MLLSTEKQCIHHTLLTYPSLYITAVSRSATFMYVITQFQSKNIYLYETQVYQWLEYSFSAVNCNQLVVCGEKLLWCQFIYEIYIT